MACSSCGKSNKSVSNNATKTVVVKTVVLPKANNVVVKK